MSSEVVNPETAQAPANGETQTMALERATPLRRDAIPVEFDPNDPVALYMNTGVFEQLQRVAKLMASSELVPQHLRGKQADCFLVAAQAFRWRMDPFSVAQHTFVTQGKLGYEGKLIAALINASGRTKENLKPVYSGEKGTPNRKVTITATIKGEDEPRTVDGTVDEWKTNNEKWKTIPDQMLMYRGAREWARRHAPEIVLGIQAEEEIEPEPAQAPRPRTLDALAERIETTVAPAPAKAEPKATVPSTRAQSKPAPPPPPPAAAATTEPPPDDSEPVCDCAEPKGRPGMLCETCAAPIPKPPAAPSAGQQKLPR